jgi:hypothetical protein
MWLKANGFVERVREFLCCLWFSKFYNELKALKADLKQWNSQECDSEVAGGVAIQGWKLWQKIGS